MELIQKTKNKRNYKISIVYQIKSDKNPISYINI